MCFLKDKCARELENLIRNTVGKITVLNHTVSGFVSELRIFINKLMNCFAMMAQNKTPVNLIGNSYAVR